MGDKKMAAVLVDLRQRLQVLGLQNLHHLCLVGRLHLVLQKAGHREEADDARTLHRQLPGLNEAGLEEPQELLIRKQWKWWGVRGPV